MITLIPLRSHPKSRMIAAMVQAMLYADPLLSLARSLG
jgi:hypothetical protein